MKSFVINLTVLLSAVCLFSGQGMDAAHADTTVQKEKIGVSAPLSGDAASYGTDVLRVLQFANQIISGDKYELVVEDDACDGKRAVTIAHSFAQRKIRYVLGVVCSNAISAAAPIYEKAGIIVISPSANLNGVTSAGKTNFTVMPDDREAMPVLAGHVCKKHKRVGLLSEQSEMSQQMAESFRLECRKLGGEPYSEDFTPSNRDFHGELLRLQKNGVEALFINTQTEITFSAALKQLRELRLTFPLYGAFFPGTGEFLKASGPLADGIEFVDLPDLSSSLNIEGQALYSQFKDRFGPMRSIQFMFATTFESFRALHLAIESHGEPGEFLAGTGFTGLYGPYSFGADGVVQGVRHVLRVIKDGRVATMPAGKE